ncbi:unnamed protein product [Mytilus edulis]|uniref:Uncharacterized protein n=1 Tax=Mytilus edulis TaxID=6550 RepID=A0A8S3RCH9_MYTED|nr:unnamed protein product [Mytilus edulis]
MSERDECLIQQVVLQDVYLPKTFCKWSSTAAGFSLQTWLQEVNVTSEKHLSKMGIVQLFQELGIGRLIDEESCQRSGAKKFIYIITDFSLGKFLAEEGLNAYEILPIGIVEKMMGLLGVTSYLNSDSCGLEYESDKDGWIKGCFEDVVLPVLPADARCKILPSCLGVDCCLGVDFLQHKFKASFELDTCRHQYMVEDLVSEKNFQINLNISLCFETFKDCLTTIQVLKDTKLPKVYCDWGTGYPQGFSLNKWLSENTYVSNTTLDAFVVAQLMEEMNLRPYLKDSQCNRASYFNITQNGWNISNDFSLTHWLEKQDVVISKSLPKSTVDLLFHQLGISGYLKDPGCIQSTYNTDNPCNYKLNIGIEKYQYEVFLMDFEYGIEKQFHIGKVIEIRYCCLDVDLIDRSLHFFVNFDPCNYVIKVGIERLEMDVLLSDYQWGKWKEMDLFGVLRINFIITDLNIDNIVVLSVNISAYFTLTGFLTENGLDFDGLQLSPIATSVLLHDLGVAPFLLQRQCDPNDLLYYPRNKGWKKVRNVKKFESFEIKDYPTERKFEVTLDITVCLESNSSCQISVPLLKNTVLPKSVCEWKSDFMDPKCNQSMAVLPNNTEPVGCHIGDTCNEVDCCITPEKIGQSFKTSINIEPCLFKLTVAIEQLQFSKWFRIVDLTAEEQYLIDLTLSVCMEADSSLPCEISVQIFNQYKLPKQKCDWNTGFLISSKYTIEDLPHLEVIVLHLTFSFCMESNSSCEFETTFLKDTVLPKPVCKLETDFQAKDCIQDTVLPNITSNPLVCHLKSSCTDISCCLNLDFIGKTIEVHLGINQDLQLLEIGVGRHQFRDSLLGFDFGNLRKKERRNYLGTIKNKSLNHDEIKWQTKKNTEKFTQIAKNLSTQTLQKD